MADIIDEANYLAEIARVAAISNVPRPSALRSTVCLNCDEPLIERFNFCDPDCRTDYELRSRMRSIPVDLD